MLIYLFVSFSNKKHKLQKIDKKRFFQFKKKTDFDTLL